MFLKTLLRLAHAALFFVAYFVLATPAYAFSGRDEINADGQQERRVLQVPTTGVGHVFAGDAGDVIDIRIIQARPVGGGVQPFRVNDVRNRINPQAILASSSTSSSGGGGGGTPTTTCPNGTQFPSAGFAASIDFLLPDPTVSGACSFLAGPSGAATLAMRVTTFTSVSAALSTFNGWTANISTLNVGFLAPITNAVTLTKAGVTFSFNLSVQTDTIGGGRLTISDFTRL